jgi:hypothetical protein
MSSAPMGRIRGFRRSRGFSGALRRYLASGAAGACAQSTAGELAGLAYYYFYYSLCFLHSTHFYPTTSRSTAFSCATLNLCPVLAFPNTRNKET